MPKKRRNTQGAQAKATTAENAARDPDDLVPELPPGATLKDEAAEIAYANYTAMRMPEDWMDAELAIVARASNLESRIQEETEILDDEDMVFLDRFGKAYSNPRNAVITSLQQQQLLLMSKIELFGTKGRKSGADAGMARKAAAKRKTDSGAGGDGKVASLLARRNA